VSLPQPISFYSYLTRATKKEEERIMRIIALVILVFALIGCAGLQLSPEAERVLSIQDTTGCQFIKYMYLQTSPALTPESLTYSMKWQTNNAGGNAYRFISQVKTSSPRGGENSMTTHFEIYKCKPME